MRDFEPEQVVKQVEPLRKLLEARDRLSDLVNKMDGNDKLEQLLNDVVNNTDSLKKLSDEFGQDQTGSKEA
jgi:type VI secretion system protein ImpB